jgi:transposase InsO family protein
VKQHANAKTTPKARLLLVQRIVEQGWDRTSAADAVGISRRCVSKWLARYRAEGLVGLQDRSSAPHRIPHQTPDSKVARIKDLRLGRLAAFQIARLLKMARSTGSAVLVRIGLNRLKDLEPKEPANRYERSRPGELLHVDVKKLGRIRGIGHRIHGDCGQRARGVGWEFVHVCIDDYSRLAYAEVLTDEKGPTAAGFLQRAVSRFTDLGMQVESVLSDNGGCYKAAFDATCEHLGIRHLRTRPYRPRTNGKAERFIQTMLREWAYAKPYTSSGWRTRALAPWLRFYNQVRPHGSLDAKPPMTRILRSG